MITSDTLRGCRMRHVAHVDGQGWHGNLSECVEHPRLRRLTRCFKRTGQTVVSLTVDEVPVADLDAAASALNVRAGAVDWSRWMDATPQEREAMRARYLAIIRREIDEARATNYARMNAALAGR